MEDITSEDTTPFRVLMLILAIVLIVTASGIYDQQYKKVTVRERWGMVQYVSVGYVNIRPIAVVLFVIGFFLLLSTVTIHTTSVEPSVVDKVRG